MKILSSKDFGLKIKERRKSLGLTQSYLAALANTGTRFISDLENGKATIQLEKALHIANILSLSIEVIEWRSVHLMFTSIKIK